MEGKGVTAEQTSSPGENGEQRAKNELSETQERGGELAPVRGANSPDTQWQQPRVRVDAGFLRRPC